MRRKVSIILTTYNEYEEYLNLCLGSILNQTYTDFELIIVCEPNDKNIEMLKRVALKDDRVNLIINSEKKGFVKSLNIGILNSNGEYIARMDSDDICTLNRLEKQVQYLDVHKDVDLIGSNLLLIDSQGTIVYTRDYPESHSAILKKFFLTNGIAHPSVMFRRTCLNHGAYDEEFKFSEDLELWLRFLKHGCIFANIQEPLILYRVREKEEVRNQEHWKYNYLARKKYSFLIWSFWKATFGIILYYIISKLPNRANKVLLKLNLVKNLKGKK